jgi:hypothetical protein
MSEEPKDTTSPQIYQRMAAINKATKAIGKTRRNATQGFMFRGIDDVYAELHPIFADNGVFLLTDVLEHSSTERITAKGGTLYHHIVKVRFTFAAEDGSSVSAIGLGEAMDSGDKAINKCLSIALKYVLFQAFLIPTEDPKDPDAETPEPTQPTKPATVATPKPKLVNEGCEKWEDWKANGETTFKMIVEASDETKEDKTEKLTKAMGFYKNKAENAKDEKVASYFFKGESFAKQAITELEKQPA